MADANIANELAVLPLDYMISAPLLATIKAQSASSKSTYDFIKQIGFVKNDSDDKVAQVNMVDFILGKDVDMPDSGFPSKLRVPLLSMVQVPYIRIEELKIDFTFDIKTTAVDSNQIKTDTSLDVKQKGFWFVPSVVIKGNITTDTVHKSSVQKRALLKVSVTAKQDEIPIGLEKVLSLFGKLIDNQVSKVGEKSQDTKDEESTDTKSDGDIDLDDDI